MCLTYLHIRCNYTYAYAWESSSKLTFNWGYEFLLVFWPQTLSSRLTKKKLQQSAPSAVLVCIMHYFTRSHTQTPCSKIRNLIQFFREINFTKFSWNWFHENFNQQKPTFFIALYLHFYCIVRSNDFFSQLYFFHRMIWWCLCIKTCKLSMWVFFSFAHFIYILKV